MGYDGNPMKDLTSQSFFSIDGYLHKKVLEDTSFVWEALQKLAIYLEKQKLGKIEGVVAKEAYLINPQLISIGKGAVVEPGAYIQGPCIIGPNSIVRHGAYVRGNVITGEGCVIGHDTEIKHSILLDRAAAPHFNYVGDSILGNDSNLGAGVKLSNFRLDHKEVSVLFNGKKIPTGLTKFGAIIGDGVQLGCNVVTNPGTLLGPKVFCFPCLNIGGILPPQKVIRG
jgi:NDP-sugar pyrophosphorylase family protein